MREKEREDMHSWGSVKLSRVHLRFLYNDDSLLGCKEKYKNLYVYT